MSKKFTLVTFAVQDGEYEYFDFYTFLTSDIQKMTDMQKISYFYHHRKSKRLERHDKYNYWIDTGRSCSIYSEKTIGLQDHETLEKFGVLNCKPMEIIPKKSNVIQLKRRTG